MIMVDQRIELEDGEAYLDIPKPCLKDDCASIMIRQKDLTIPSELGDDRTQEICLELDELPRLQMCAASSLDWKGEHGSRIIAVGDGLVAVDQTDEGAYERGCPTKFQRVILLEQDIDAILRLAA